MKTIVLNWRGHTGNPQAFPRRVWRNDWPHDSFEIIKNEAEWDALNHALMYVANSMVGRFLTIRLVEAEDNGL